jgi:hypothetical protein
MAVKIVNGPPPADVWERARRELGATEATTVFTYGKTVYVPGGFGLSFDLETHEAVHTRQQGEDPAGWWERYFADPLFRLEQETEAYRAQYRAFCRLNKDRNEQARFLTHVAGTLAGKLYGGIVSFHAARQSILA